MTLRAAPRCAGRAAAGARRGEPGRAGRRGRGGARRGGHRGLLQAAGAAQAPSLGVAPAPPRAVGRPAAACRSVSTSPAPALSALHQPERSVAGAIGDAPYPPSPAPWTREVSAGRCGGRCGSACVRCQCPCAPCTPPRQCATAGFNRFCGRRCRLSVTVGAVGRGRCPAPWDTQPLNMHVCQVVPRAQHSTASRRSIAHCSIVDGVFRRLALMSVLHLRCYVASVQRSAEHVLQVSKLSAISVSTVWSIRQLRRITYRLQGYCKRHRLKTSTNNV